MLKFLTNHDILRYSVNFIIHNKFTFFSQFHNNDPKIGASQI